MGEFGSVDLDSRRGPGEGCRDACGGVCFARISCVFYYYFSLLWIRVLIFCVFVCIVLCVCGPGDDG